MDRYWEMLVDEMRATGEFDNSRLKHCAVRQTHYADRSVILPETEKFVPRKPIYAHVARLKTKDPQWQEYAWAYVRPGRDGNGLLGEITTKLLAQVPTGIKLFAITKRMAVMTVLQRHGFEPITQATMPIVAVWAKNIVGLDDKRFPGSAHSWAYPVLQEGERQLFIRNAG